MRRADRNTWLAVLAIALLCVAMLMLGGCVNSQTRSEGRRVLERVETPTADGGKVTRETERTETGSETVTKADLAAALQATMAGLRGDLPGMVAAVIPKPPAPSDFAAVAPKPPTLFGMDLAQLIALVAALWGGERAVSTYHKRKQARKDKP